MNSICPVCDGSLEAVRVAHETWTGERHVSVEVDAQRCVSCGEVLVAGAEIREMQARANDRVRREDGLLAPAEIQAIRAAYGLSQDAFERLIKAGQKTVTRWERGTVCQTGTADTLLRILRDHPSVTAALAAERGVTLKPRPNAADTTQTPGRSSRKKAA